MTQALHLALLGAMPEEIGSDLSHLKDLTCSDHGDLTIHRGSWGDDVRISLAWSGWGKVSAARAATRLLASDPSIDLLVFTGVAGAADPALRQWDVVLADAVVQHDMDARPLFPRFTLPALNQAQLQPQPAWFNWAKTALLEAHSAGDLDGFARPSSGLIATGIASSAIQRCCKRCGMPCPTCGPLRWKAPPSRRWPSRRASPGWCCG